MADEITCPNCKESKYWVDIHHVCANCGYGTRAFQRCCNLEMYIMAWLTVAKEFIEKVESGKARSTKTYSDLKRLAAGVPRSSIKAMNVLAGAVIWARDEPTPQSNNTLQKLVKEFGIVMAEQPNRWEQ